MMLLASIGFVRVRNTFDDIVRLIDDGVVSLPGLSRDFFGARNAWFFACYAGRFKRRIARFAFFKI